MASIKKLVEVVEQKKDFALFSVNGMDNKIFFYKYNRYEVIDFKENGTDYTKRILKSNEVLNRYAPAVGLGDFKVR